MPVIARKALQPAEILEQLETLRAQEPELLRRMNEEAELSISSQNDTRYKAAVEAKVAHDQNITRLQSALAGAEARSKEEAKAQRLAAAAAVRERFFKVIDQRQPLAQKMQDKITELVRLWRDWIEINNKACIAYPDGPPPTGMGLTNSEALQQFATELYRQGATVPVTGRPQLERLPPTIPGARSPDYMLIHQPERIVPFTTVIEQANNLAHSIMEGKRNAA
jgi:hypothetical protein